MDHLYYLLDKEYQYLGHERGEVGPHQEVEDAFGTINLLLPCHVVLGWVNGLVALARKY